MSESGTFRKCRNVRLESGMRTKADLRRPLWIYGFTPWLRRAYESELRTGYERNMLSRRVVICPSRLGKNSDYRAGVARSVTTANHRAMLARNAFKTSGIERRAEAMPLSRARRAFSAMYATKRSKPRMLSMRVKL